MTAKFNVSATVSASQFAACWLTITLMFAGTLDYNSNVVNSNNCDFPIMTSQCICVENTSVVSLLSPITALTGTAILPLRSRGQSHCVGSSPGVM